MAKEPLIEEQNQGERPDATTTGFQSIQAGTVRESYASEALIAAIPGILIAALGGIVLYYQTRQGGMWVALGVVIIAIGIAIVIRGVYFAAKVPTVKVHTFPCPFCEKNNDLTQVPESDFRCVHCNREVPVRNGQVLEVFQVRCGYCNTLNYYSEKSTGLICEECDREIPIAGAEDSPTKKVFAAYTVHDDDQPYDLILVNAPKTEDMISCLQHMLALNRNQVKDLLEDLPQTLLTGIPKKKAELLTAQIAAHKGKAETKVSEY